MIIDETGIFLIPGNNGTDCPGNGRTKDKDGNLIPCCCDECNYMMCCLETHKKSQCKKCEDINCPRKNL